MNLERSSLGSGCLLRSFWLCSLRHASTSFSWSTSARTPFPSTEVHRHRSNHLLSSKLILQNVKESKSVGKSDQYKTEQSHLPSSISWPSSSWPFSASSIASSCSSRAVFAYRSKNSSSVSSCSSFELADSEPYNAVD